MSDGSTDLRCRNKPLIWLGMPHIGLEPIGHLLVTVSSVTVSQVDYCPDIEESRVAMRLQTCAAYALLESYELAVLGQHDSDMDCSE